MYNLYLQGNNAPKSNHPGTILVGDNTPFPHEFVMQLNLEFDSLQRELVDYMKHELLHMKSPTLFRLAINTSLNRSYATINAPVDSYPIVSHPV